MVILDNRPSWVWKAVCYSSMCPSAITIVYESLAPQGRRWSWEPEGCASQNNSVRPIEKARSCCRAQGTIPSHWLQNTIGCEKKVVNICITGSEYCKSTTVKLKITKLIYFPCQKQKRDRER